MFRLAIELLALLYVARLFYKVGRDTGRAEGKVREACPIFSPDPDVPEYCEGCTMLRTAHAEETLP